MTEQIPEPLSDNAIDPLDDPDLQAADSAVETGEDPDALSSDSLDVDPEDGTWEPDQHLSNATAGLITHADADAETLDERLAQEVPDVDADHGGSSDADREVREV